MKTAWLPGRLAGLIAMALLATSVAAPARGDVKLRWKFTKGKTIHYLVTQKTRNQVEANGQKFDATADQVTEMTWEVKSVAADGSAQVVQTIGRVKSSMDVPTLGKTEFDTKDGKDPEGPMAAMGPILRALVGAPIALTISPRGEVSNVVLPKDLVESLKKADPAGAAAGAISEEGLKELTEQTTLVLPEKSVAVGASWDKASQVEMPQFGTMKIVQTYTYDGPATQGGAKVEKIGVDLKMEIKPQEGAAKVDLKSQDSKGAFFFDNVAGYLKGSEIVQKMRMVISIQGMEVVQDSESTVSMKEQPAAGSSKPGR